MRTEKRIAPRVPKRLTLRVHAPDDAKGFVAITTNVSTTGMFLSTPRLFPRGTRLKLITDAGHLEVEVARTARHDHRLEAHHTGIGVRFVGELAAPAPAPVPAAKPAWVLSFANATEFLDVLRRDLKHGGAFIRSATKPELHEENTVRIEVPLRAPVSFEFRARVVFLRADGFAVQFLDRQAVTDALLKPA